MKEIFHYLHLGSDVTVHSDDLIGIFDIERVTVKKAVNEFLKAKQKSGKIYYVSLDLPKSFAVVSGGEDEDKVYVTNVSTLTLKKRLKKSK
ncbi:MAG: DUF370 domain-containing protein [Oscillospiraceae bacterium]|nr:DUF370 domain-containing protein [Oscillospiraceae bacterium]